MGRRRGHGQDGFCLRGAFRIQCLLPDGNGGVVPLAMANAPPIKIAPPVRSTALSLDAPVDLQPAAAPSLAPSAAAAAAGSAAAGSPVGVAAESGGTTPRGPDGAPLLSPRSLTLHRQKALKARKRSDARRRWALLRANLARLLHEERKRLGLPEPVGRNTLSQQLWVTATNDWRSRSAEQALRALTLLHPISERRCRCCCSTRR